MYSMPVPRCISQLHQPSATVGHRPYSLGSFVCVNSFRLSSSISTSPSSNSVSKDASRFLAYNRTRCQNYSTFYKYPSNSTKLNKIFYGESESENFMSIALLKSKIEIYSDSLKFHPNIPKSQSGGTLTSGMSVSDRIGRIMRSLIERAVSGREDPEVLFEQAAIEMNKDLVQLKKASSQVIASKTILEEKYKRARALSDTWYHRARRALQLGDENLSRNLLKRRKVYEENAQALKRQLDTQIQLAYRVLSSAKVLEEKILEAQFKKDSLKSRAQAAKSTKYISEMIASIDPSSALATFERMEQKVIRLEMEANSYSEIISDDLSSKFAQLENEADVSEEMMNLKKEVYGSKTIGDQLPPFQREVERDRSGGRMGSGY